MMVNRRGLLVGLASIIAAPAIVRAGNLMPIKVMADPAVLTPGPTGPFLGDIRWFGNLTVTNIHEVAASFTANDRVMHIFDGEKWVRYFDLMYTERAKLCDH